MWTKLTVVCKAILLAGSVAIGATWEMDSSPFSWSGDVSIIQKQTEVNEFFSYRFLSGNKIAFSFTIPRSNSAMTFSLYSLNGVLLHVETIGTKPETVSLNRNVTLKSTGTFIAVLRTSSGDKKCTLTVIR